MGQKVLNNRLDDVVEALRALAASTRDNDADIVESRAETVRVAGVAFEEQLEEVCLQHASVFEAPNGEDDDEDDYDYEPARELLWLVDKIRLYEITFGGYVAGLENAGGKPNVLIVPIACFGTAPPPGTLSPCPR